MVTRSSSLFSSRPNPRWPNIDLALVLVVLVVAGFFRLWRIADVPPGLSYDEAAFGHMSLRILAGDWLQVYELGSVHSYLAAPFVGLLGRTPLALRLPEAIAGIVTAAVLYLFVREAFGKRLAAVLAALIYAITFQTIHVSRLAFPPNPLPLIQVTSYYFLWRGWKRSENWSLVVGGLVLGLSLHTYQASLFLTAAVAVCWAGWIWLKRKAAFREALLFWGGFLLPAIPFAAIVLPGMIGAPRYGNQFILNPQVHGGDSWQLVFEQILRHAGMYGFTGDRAWRHNIPGRPFFSLPVSVLFWGGILLSLKRLRSGPFAFLLVQFLFLLLPGLLAWTSLGPLILHLAGILTLSCVFPALAADWIYKEATGWRQWAGTAWVSLVCILLVATAYRTYVDYFEVWASEVGTTMSFDETFVETAEALNTRPGSVDAWVLPLAPDQPNNVRARSFDFVYTGSAPAMFVPANEGTAGQQLAEIVGPGSRVGLVDWDPQALAWAAPVYGDPRNFLGFLLGRAGQLLERQEWPGFRTSIYYVPSPDFVLPSPNVEQTEIVFADQLALTAYDSGSVVSTDQASGDVLPVALRWSALQSVLQDYKAVVTLDDRTGHRISQDDQVLRDGLAAPTGDWEPGQSGWDVRLVPVPPGTPAGEYQLTVAVYDPETLEKLTVTAGPRVAARIGDVGPVEIASQAHRAPVPSIPVDHDLGDPPQLRLVGFEPIPDQVRPGDTVKLTVHWQALRDLPQVTEIVLLLADLSQDSIVQEATYPSGDTHPPSQWRSDEWVTVRYDFLLDRHLSAGRYLLRLEAWSGSLSLGRVDLKPIEILSWEKRFELPSTEHSIDVRFGKAMRLIGYGLRQESTGEPLQINLCWQALAEMNTSYVTFVHLVDSDGVLLSQVDVIPGQGAFPTTAWLPKEVVCSDYQLPVGPDVLSGDETLRIGVYDPVFEQRLPVTDGQGNDLGDTYEIAPPPRDEE